MQAKLSELALALIAPGNRILYDDKGLPSVMVEIPQMKMSDLISGGDNSVHPAFLVNGEEKESIFISKYQNCVHEGRAYSLPAMAPGHSLTFDAARQYCETKGAGWHLMTAAEYALIALICRSAGFFPIGNNSRGKDIGETAYSGIPATYQDGGIMHIFTGTGSRSYSHNNSRSGIFDLNGNVSEWVGGKRTVHGEIQLIPNNDAADSACPQTSAATTWRAIDATTGSFIEPDGSGTTYNSVKVDAPDGVPVLDIAVTHESADFYCPFKDLSCSSSIDTLAVLTLQAYGLLPVGSGWLNDRHFYNNVSAEQFFGQGGNFLSGNSAGVACANGAIGARTYSSEKFGFRAAYVSL